MIYTPSTYMAPLFENLRQGNDYYKHDVFNQKGSIIRFFTVFLLKPISEKLGSTILINFR